MAHKDHGATQAPLVLRVVSGPRVPAGRRDYQETTANVDRLVHKALREPLVGMAVQVYQGYKDLRGLKASLDHQENRVLREAQGLKVTWVHRVTKGMMDTKV